MTVRAKDLDTNPDDLEVKSSNQRLSGIQVKSILKEMEIVNKIINNNTGIILKWRYFFIMIIIALIAFAESASGEILESLFLLALILAFVLFLIEAVPHDWQISNLYRLYELDKIIKDEVIQRNLTEFIYCRKPAEDIRGKIKNLIGTPGYIIPHSLLILSISAWILLKRGNSTWQFSCGSSLGIFSCFSFACALILLILCYYYVRIALRENRMA